MDFARGNFGAADFKFDFGVVKFGALPLNVEAHAGAEFGTGAEVGLIGVAFEEAGMEGVAALGVQEKREDFYDARVGGADWTAKRHGQE